MVKAIQKSLNWRNRKVRAAAVLALAGAGLAAGFFGAAVRRAIAGEPVAGIQYCVYEVSGLTGADVRALHGLGYPVQLTPLGSNSGYFCVLCNGTGAGCPDAPALPPGVTLLIVSHSSACGICALRIT